jgi:lipid-A-disaccharide synthase-like uncharacterized protein
MFTHVLSWLTANHTSCTTTVYVWIIVGFLGQALFTARFIVQWFKSEIVGKSVIPMAFWYFSVGGGVVLLAYAIYRMDPVFIVGQAGGLAVYARNLYLIFRERAAERRSAA